MLFRSTASWSLVHNSGFSRNLSKVDTVVNNAADRVNRAPTSCDYTIYVEAAALSQGWEASAISATYRYYVPGASATAAGTWKRSKASRIRWFATASTDQECRCDAPMSRLRSTASADCAVPHERCTRRLPRRSR